MKFPTMDEFAQNVAEKALDEIEINGKTIREWIDIIYATELGTDCISRQQAIDALTEYRNGRAVYISVKEAVRRIEQLLPAQLGTNLAEVGTDVPDINVGDIISRSSLLAKYDKEHEGPPGRARKLIEEEPPVYTEFIYCKDCRHRDDYGCCKYWRGLAMSETPIATDDYDFCNHARRREVTT